MRRYANAESNTLLENDSVTPFGTTCLLDNSLTGLAVGGCVPKTSKLYLKLQHAALILFRARCWARSCIFNVN